MRTSCEAPALGRCRMYKVLSVRRGESRPRVGPPGQPVEKYMKYEYVSEESFELNADWIVYGVERNEIIFAEIPDKEQLYVKETFLDVGIRRLMKIGGHLMKASLDTAEAWIQEASIHEIAGIDGVQSSWINNTGRCGSTLLHRVLLKANVISLSEPHWVDQIIYGNSAHVNEDHLIRTVKICCILDWHIAATFWKRPDTNFFSINAKPGTNAHIYFAKAFPRAKHIFLYRTTHKVVESFGSIWEREERKIMQEQNRRPSLVLPLLQKLSWKMLGFGLPPIPSERIQCLQNEFKLSLYKLSRPKVVAGVVRWIDNTLGFLNDIVPIVHDFRTIRMDELVHLELRKAIVQQVLSYLGLVPEHGSDAILDTALTAFHTNSQNGSAMNRESDRSIAPFLTDQDSVLIYKECLATAFAHDNRILIDNDAPNFLIHGSLGTATTTPHR